MTGTDRDLDLGVLKGFGSLIPCLKCVSQLERYEPARSYHYSCIWTVDKYQLLAL